MSFTYVNPHDTPVFIRSSCVFWLPQYNPADETFTRSEMALYRRLLMKDHWPMVAVRSVGVRLLDGAIYVPALVSAIEGAVTIWECSEAGREKLLGLAARLPTPKRSTIYYCAAKKTPSGWIDRDVEPLKTIACAGVHSSASVKTA